MHQMAGQMDTIYDPWHFHPYPKPYASLCATFWHMAQTIWVDLGDARKFNLHLGEETITETFTLDVQRLHEHEVFTLQFNKMQEARNGADWEWWLTDGQWWVGILIQAKVLNHKSNTYSHIKHKVRGSNTSQIRLLIQEAARKRIAPLYFLYNHTNLNSPPIHWNCCRPIYMQQLGCAIAHASSIDTIIKQGGAGIVKVSAASLPLQCLACCPWIESPAATLPLVADGILRRLANLNSSDGPTDTSYLRREPPDYVKSMISVRGSLSSEIVRSIRSAAGPIGALSVFRDFR